MANDMETSNEYTGCDIALYVLGLSFQAYPNKYLNLS